MPRQSLQPSRDPADYDFAHRLRTRFAETDAMGIIHHGAYAPYLEEARIAMLRTAGHPYEAVRATGIDLTVLELAVRYRRPLRFDELVDVRSVVRDVGRTCFQIDYRLEVGGELRATASTVHGAVSADGRPRRLPDWLTALAPAAGPSSDAPEV
jgi:acyl-CoA thioester hydrolase